MEDIIKLLELIDEYNREARDINLRYEAARTDYLRVHPLIDRYTKECRGTVLAACKPYLDGDIGSHTISPAGRALLARREEAIKLKEQIEQTKSKLQDLERDLNNLNPCGNIK